MPKEILTDDGPCDLGGPPINHNHVKNVPISHQSRHRKRAAADHPVRSTT